MSTNTDPINIEFVINSPELMAEYQKLVAGGKSVDESVDALRNKYQQLTAAQVLNAKGAQDVVQAVNSISVAVKKTDFDNFGLSKENIAIQKQVIKELESELKKLDKELTKLAPGQAKLKVSSERNTLAQELQAEKDSLQKIEQQVKATEVTYKSLETQYGRIINEMRELEVAKQTESKRYEELKTQAVEYQTAMQQVSAEVKAQSTSSFEGIVQGLGLVSGGLAAVQGATALYVGENENLNKIMLKVQSLMAITIGLQQIHEALNKKSAFSIQILSKANTFWAATNLRVATTLGISTVAAQAFMATITLGLSVAITALLVWLDKLAANQQKVAEEQKKMASAVADAASEMITSYYKLQNQWNALGNDLKAKEKFINGNQSAFKKLGFEVKNVSDAERLLKDGTNSFVDAMMARAKAIAAAQIAQEKFKEYLTEKAKATEELSNPTVGQGIVYWFQDKVMGKSIDEIVASKYNDVEKIQEAGIDLLKQQDQYEKQYDSIIQGLGLKKYLGNETKPKTPTKPKPEAEIFSDGSVESLTQQISLIDNALKRMGKDGQVRLRALDKYGKEYATGEVANLQTTLTARLKLTEQLEAAEKKIKSKSLQETLTELEQQWKDYYQYQKQYGTEAANTQFQGIKTLGMSFFEALGNQRDRLSNIVENGGKLTDQQKLDLDFLNTKINELTGQKSELDLFSDKTEKQLSRIPLVSDQIDYLIDQRDRLKNDGVDQGKWNFLDGFISSKTSELNQMVSEFVNSHQNLEEQKTEITRKYEAIRTEIEKRKIGTDEKARLVTELEKQKQIEIDAAKDVAFQKTDIYRRLSENLIGISKRELDLKIKFLQDYLANAENIDPTVRAKLEKSLEEAKDVKGKSNTQVQINALKQQELTIQEALKDKTKLTANEVINLENEAAALTIQMEKLKKASSFSETAEWASMISSTFSELSASIGDSNEGLSDTIATIGQLAGAVADVAGGIVESIMYGNPIAAIGGIIKGISKIISIGKAARESEKKAAEEMKKRQDEIFQSGIDYNAMLRQRLATELKLNDAVQSRVNAIREERNANKKNFESIERDYQNVFNRLMKSKTVTGQHTEKYGGFLGLGRKTKTVDEEKTIAEILGIGTYKDSKVFNGFSVKTVKVFEPGNVQITDELLDKLDAINAKQPLTGDAKAAYEQLKKLRDEYSSIADAQRELAQELTNTITGTTPQAISDSIRQGILSGKKEFADFADDIEGFLRGAILAGMETDLFKTQIKALQDEFAKMAEDGTITEDERNTFQSMYMAVVDETKKQMELMNQAGINMNTSSSSNANSLQGAYKAASQESIDLLSGNTAGLRLAVLETNAINKGGFAAMLESSSKMVAIQLDIEKNTRKTAENTEKLHDIDKGITDLGGSMDKEYKALQAAGIIR